VRLGADDGAGASGGVQLGADGRASDQLAAQEPRTAGDQNPHREGDWENRRSDLGRKQIQPNTSTII